VFIAMFQSYGIAVGSRALRGSFGAAVIDPGHSSASSGHHAGRRHHVPDVDRRADHRTRRRQWHSLIIMSGTPTFRTPGPLLDLGRTGALSPFFIVGFIAGGVRHRVHRVHRAERSDESRSSTPRRATALAAT
jgi:preprotein translocase subunit SecY